MQVTLGPNAHGGHHGKTGLETHFDGPSHFLHVLKVLAEGKETSDANAMTDMDGGRSGSEHTFTCLYATVYLYISQGGKEG